MAKIDLLDPKWVDLVFANKNKEYGAYQLRKSVSSRNIKALAILLIAAFLGGGYLAFKIKQHNDELAELEAYNAQMELKALEEAKKEQEKRKEQQKKPEPKIEPEKVVPETRATIQYTAPVIKDDDEVKAEMPPQNVVNKKTEAISSVTQEGTDDRSTVAARAEVATPEQVLPPPPPKEEPKIEEPKEDINKKVFKVAEQMPSFKGNVNQWLASHLQYPAVAAENNIQGKVIVQFVVSRDGSVRDAQVVRGVDPSLDREALRVVNSMPKWNPGMNNGQAANVQYTLPITFKLQ